MPAPRIVIVGSINMDLVARAPRLPAPGETVHGSDFFMAPGGKGGNQAVAARRLGAEAILLGAVGDDLFGDTLLTRLQHDTVDTRHVARIPRSPSGVALIGVDSRGENAITVVAGANAALSPADVEAHEALLAGADLILVQLEIPLETAVSALQIARAHGVRTLLDPAPAPMPPLPPALLDVDYLTPNQAEAERLTGVTIVDARSAREAADRLHGLGVAAVLITMGKDGCYVDDAGFRHIPPYRVTAVDTTACGDAFAAALGVGLAEGMRLDEAVDLASAAGALASTRAGAQDAMPVREEVERLRSHGERITPGSA